MALLDGSADIDQVTAGDRTSPMLMATMNGYFDLALILLDRGADPDMASHAGTKPLCAAINTRSGRRGRATPTSKPASSNQPRTQM